MTKYVWLTKAERDAQPKWAPPSKSGWSGRAWIVVAKVIPAHAISECPPRP